MQLSNRCSCLLCVVVSFDPWMLGSILLAVWLFLALLALLAALLYIVCYRIKNKLMIIEGPSVIVRLAYCQCFIRFQEL